MSLLLFHRFCYLLRYEQLHFTVGCSTHGTVDHGDEVEEEVEKGESRDDYEQDVDVVVEGRVDDASAGVAAQPAEVGGISFDDLLKSTLRI